MEFHHAFLAGVGALVVSSLVGTLVLFNGEDTAHGTVVNPAPAAAFAALPSQGPMRDAPTRDLDLGAAPTAAQVLPRLELFAEEARGRQFKQPVAVTPLSDKAFLDQLRKTDGPAPLNPGWDATVSALHLVPTSFNFLTLRTQQEAEVGGFYDLATKRLYVRSDVLDPLAQSILVHELTHALDDQYVDLDGLTEAASDDDQSSAVDALIEGDARWVEDQFVNALTEQRQTQLQTEERAEFGGRVSPDKVPYFLQELSSFPYDSGSDFIQSLRTDGGSTAVDDAFADPPSSTLQIIDASYHFEHRVEPVAVTEPGIAGGRVVDSGTLGVLLLGSVLSENAPSAWAGDPRLRMWAGDAYETVRTGDQTCVRDAVESQPGGLPRLHDSLSGWAADVPGASVTVTGTSSLLLVVCSN